MTTTCPDWATRLQRRELPTAAPLDGPKADRISAVLGNLRLPDLSGQPYLRDLPNIGWVDGCTRAIFGNDQVREAFLLVPKKSGKSALFGLSFLSAFLIDPKPQASYSVIAPSIGVAGLVFSIITGAIRADDELSALLHITEHTRTIKHRRTQAVLSIKSFSLESITGLRGNVLLDEVHLMGASSAGTKLRAQIKGALASDPKARVIYVTTQSDSPPKGIFSDLLATARAVRDGEHIDAGFLPVLWEPWPDCPDPLTDPSVWPLLLPSYPNLGDEAFYKGVTSEALRSGPTAAAIAKSQFFNVEVGQHSGDDAWYLAEHFTNLAPMPMSIEQVIQRSEYVGIGIDLGGLSDLSALAVIGVTSDDRWLAASRAWCTQKALDDNAEQRSALDDFVDDRDLIVGPPGGDVASMVDICIRVRDSGKLHAVGIDPAGAADLADALEAASFDLTPDDGDVMGVSQSSFRLNPAVATLGRRAEDRRLLIGHTRLMSWSLGNVVATDKGHLTEISRRSISAKIDRVAALLDAASTLVLRRRKPAFDVRTLIG